MKSEIKHKKTILMMEIVKYLFCFIFKCLMYVSSVHFVNILTQNKHVEHRKLLRYKETIYSGQANRVEVTVL